MPRALLRNSHEANMANPGFESTRNATTAHRGYQSSRGDARVEHAQSSQDRPRIRIRSKRGRASSFEPPFEIDSRLSARRTLPDFGPPTNGSAMSMQILPGLAIENVPAIPEVIQNWDRHEVKMQIRIVGADLPAFPNSCSRQVKEGNLISMPSHCQEERVDAVMRTVSKFPEWNVSRHEYFFRRRFHRFVSPSPSSSTCEVEEPCSCRTFFCRVFA